MLYDLTLEITYDYDAPADVGRHVLRLTPKDVEGVQRIIAVSETIIPKPKEWINRVDFFGNHFLEINFNETQDNIRFEVKARVERKLLIQPDDISPTLSELAAQSGELRSLDAMSPHHFVGASKRVATDPAITEYARACVTENASIMQIAQAIGLALHRDMSFDPDATTVDTSAIEAFRAKHGVCQDFTHIMIAALRGLGIPAGYVSGFIRTIPPEGEPVLEGADAMHAWVTVWGGNDQGWFEYDPTNGIFALGDHIMIGIGRDYSDISPVKGLTRTAGGHETEQKVTVKLLS